LCVPGRCFRFRVNPALSVALGDSCKSSVPHLGAAHLLNDGTPAGVEGRIGLPVAGADDATKRKVMDLVDEVGVDPVDAGGIDDSRRQQPGQPVSGTDLPADRLRQALAEANSQRSPALRAA
jgi:predicted dinucleotide-binding enzyme